VVRHFFKQEGELNILHQINNTGYVLTIHAERRAQQRGIKFNTIEFVLKYGDIRLHAGEGCMSIRISQKAFTQMAQDGVSIAMMGRAKNVVVVFNLTTMEIVTLLHDYGSKDSRCYRCQLPTRSTKRKRIQKRISEYYPEAVYYPEAGFLEQKSNIPYMASI